MLSRLFLIGLGRFSLIISEGVFPELSYISLSAPFNNNALTGLVDLNYSTLLTAKCSGVSPFSSFALTSGSMLNM